LFLEETSAAGVNRAAMNAIIMDDDGWPYKRSRIARAL
jgi:hypothetical protein